MEAEMADYLIVYQGSNQDWTKAPAEQIRAVMEQWGAWFKELESKGVLRNPGSALAPGGAVIRANGKGFVTDTTMAEVKELIGGFTVVQAESLEQAAKIAESSPFLRNNPEGRIQVRPVFEPKP
jgi:hypothetical protein